MKTNQNVIFLVSIIVSLCLLVLLLYSKINTSKITIESISPDGKQKVELEEKRLPFQVDRNFKIVLVDINNDKEIMIFKSPDEGGTTKKERFIWSLDGDYILLIGEHLLTEGDTQLETGENLYFLYQLSTQKIWCNSNQIKGVPKFSKEDIKNLKFKNLIY